MSGPRWRYCRLEIHQRQIGAHHTGRCGPRIVNGERRRNLVAAPRLMLTGDAATDNGRRVMWRRTFAGSTEPLPPRERKLAALRHRRDVVDDALALERAFQWRRTRDRLAAVGITTRTSAPTPRHLTGVS